MTRSNQKRHSFYNPFSFLADPLVYYILIDEDKRIEKLVDDLLQQNQQAGKSGVCYMYRGEEYTIYSRAYVLKHKREPIHDSLESRNSF